MIAFYLAATTTVAAPTQAPTVEFDHCEALDTHHTRELLSIELSTLREQLGAVPTTIQILCRGQRAIIVVRTTGSEPGVDEDERQARIELSSTESPSRPRLLALTATELVAEAWGERERAARVVPESPDAPSPSPEPPDEARVEARVEVEAPEARPWSVDAMPRVSWAGSPTTFTWGGQLDVDRQLFAPLRLTVGAELGTGRTSTGLTEVNVLEASGHLGGLLQFSGPHLDAAVGPAVRLGAVRLRPEAADGFRATDVVGIWGGPVLLLRATSWWTSHWGVRLQAEAGFMTLPVRGLVDGRETLYEFDGPWVSIAAGVAWGG